MDVEVVKKLEAAISGLSWMSESDYPFEVVMWGASALTKAEVLKRFQHPGETSVITVSIHDFFRRAIEPQSWHNAEEAAMVGRYQNLLTTLETLLQNVQVFKVGAGTLDIYILGSLSTDQVAGVMTRAVET